MFILVLCIEDIACFKYGEGYHCSPKFDLSVIYVISCIVLVLVLWKSFGFAERWWGWTLPRFWRWFLRSRRLRWGMPTRIRSTCLSISALRRPGLFAGGLLSTRYCCYHYCRYCYSSLFEWLSDLVLCNMPWMCVIFNMLLQRNFYRLFI